MGLICPEPIGSKGDSGRLLEDGGFELDLERCVQLPQAEVKEGCI